MPLHVSVIIPTHNRAPLIRRAVDSALAQCRDGDEVIVIDDASTDGTEEILGPYAGRIIYRKTAHGGAGGARNAGIEAARNPLIAFLDSDDEWLPGKLDLQRALLGARPDLVLCWTDLDRHHASGVKDPKICRYLPAGDAFLGPAVPFSSVAPLPPGRSDVPVRIGDLFRWNIHAEIVQVGTMMYRRSLAPDVRYPTDLKYREDWEFAARLARLGPAAHLDAILEIVHRHDGPQIIKQAPVVRLGGWITVLTRLWGADEAFLSRHREEYEAVLEDARAAMTRALLVVGRVPEARAELARMKRPSFLLRACAASPAGLIVGLLAARRLFFRLLYNVIGDPDPQYKVSVKAGDPA